jgi:hypothetical protein
MVIRVTEPGRPAFQLRSGMDLKNSTGFDINSDLIDAIRGFPAHREIEHCGTRLLIDPFDFYADCPRCGTRIKVRSYSANPEIEDIFDAVFEWMNQDEAGEVAWRRQSALLAEE